MKSGAASSLETRGKLFRWSAWSGPLSATPFAEETSVLARFLYSPGRLFAAGMASWLVLRAALVVCAWLGLPSLAFCLTLAIVSIGFASCALSVLDWQQPLSQQWRRFLAALACWTIVGVGCLNLF
jgi:hypothetical protein